MIGRVFQFGQTIAIQQVWVKGNVATKNHIKMVLIGLLAIMKNI
ncbi:AB1gp69 [Acinetobacter phage AB1]|uniref:AB1gp69 n=1 Tax=Acinetobacter phage AB1 TaxID=889876 RepID=E2GM07_9CAUD|nr:AB1gp69 [Acinetobacter phage AB1]ADO14440.1 AB1gp69 [Acinetobacter phage AB1]